MENVLITGATSGIGYEFAKIFAQNNYNLILCARSKDKLEEIKEKIIREYKVKVLVFSKDLSKENEIPIKYRKENYKKKENINKPSKKQKIHNESKESYNGVIGLTQQTFKTLIDAIKNIKSIDMLALGLTILTMVTLGIILWVIPFTHDWMYNTFIGIFK